MFDSFRPNGLQPHQAPPSVGCPRQEYWTGLPFPPPVNLPNPGIPPVSPAYPALAGGFFTAWPPGRWQSMCSQPAPAQHSFGLPKQSRKLELLLGFLSQGAFLHRLHHPITGKWCYEPCIFSDTLLLKKHSWWLWLCSSWLQCVMTFPRCKFLQWRH